MTKVEGHGRALDSTTAVVVGAGVMGAAIAQVLALAGASVTCCDRAASQLAEARRLLRSGRYGLDGAVLRGRISGKLADAADQRITFDGGLESVDDADLVIEAVPEQLTTKLELFADLGRRAPEATVLASNTSGLPIEAMAQAAGRPHTTVGWHWSSPAQVMPLAEVVRTAWTSDATVEIVCEAARACGKRPVVIRENPSAWGFVANRVLRAAIQEARMIESEGVADAEAIDQILVDAFGWPVGPLSVLRGATEGWGDGRSGSVDDLLAPPPHLGQ